jgi:transposase
VRCLADALAIAIAVCLISADVGSGKGDIAAHVACLLRERIQHVNRIKGLLAGQGITGYDPLHKDRRTRLDGLMTGDGRPLPGRLKAALLRELARIELLLQQIADVEAERDVSIEADVDGRPSPVALLARLKAIGPQIGAVLYHEGL